MWATGPSSLVVHSHRTKSAMIVIFHIVEVRLPRQRKRVLISAPYNLYCLKGFTAVDRYLRLLQVTRWKYSELDFPQTSTKRHNSSRQHGGTLQPIRRPRHHPSLPNFPAVYHLRRPSYISFRSLCQTNSNASIFTSYSDYSCPGRHRSKSPNDVPFGIASET